MMAVAEIVCPQSSCSPTMVHCVDRMETFLSLMQATYFGSMAETKERHWRRYAETGTSLPLLYCFGACVEGCMSGQLLHATNMAAVVGTEVEVDCAFVPSPGTYSIRMTSLA